jgi:hypothetical protein
VICVCGERSTRQLSYTANRNLYFKGNLEALFRASLSLTSE